jgi:hypothetical protein
MFRPNCSGSWLALGTRVVFDVAVAVGAEGGPLYVSGAPKGPAWGGALERVRPPEPTLLRQDLAHHSRALPLLLVNFTKIIPGAFCCMCDIAHSGERPSLITNILAALAGIYY